MILYTYYKVSINNATDAAPYDGFIDNTTPFGYLQRSSDGSEVTGYSNDTDTALMKVRGYVRYIKILQQIEQVMNILDVLNIVKTGADQNTEASIFSMTLTFDREMDFMTTPDENNTGTILTGKDAVKRFIARALSGNYNEKIAFPNPVNANATTLPYGPETLMVQTGPIGNKTLTDIESLITVSQVSDTFPQSYITDPSV